MCRGYVEQQNDKMESYAWVVCNLANVHLERKNQISMKDLLPDNSDGSNLNQELKKTASDSYYKEQSIMKLLEANSGKFNS